MAKGFYKTLSSIIRQMKADGKIIIDIDVLKNRIDLSELDREELEDKCKGAMSAVELYQNGFRSIIRGRGIFIDYAKARNRTVLEQLVRNVAADEKQKSSMVDILETIIDGVPETDDNQMRLCFDEDGQLAVDDKGRVILAEEMSKQELLELLYKLV